MHHHIRWRSRPNAAKLERSIDELRTENVRLRHELQTKQSALGGLELALQARHETIDALNARLEQSRAQCRRRRRARKLFQDATSGLTNEAAS
jgi:hypothetical protein